MSRGLRFPSIEAIADDGLRGAARAAASAMASAPDPVLPPAPARRRRSDGEHQEAKALMQMVRAHHADQPVLVLFHAIPNGGQRGKAAAGKAKAEGQLAGVSDYFLPAARQGFHGLYVELKTQTGAPSRQQREFIQAVRDNGYRAEVCRGWREAWAVLRDYLGMDGAA
jgi:hypothetical protein